MLSFSVTAYEEMSPDRQEGRRLVACIRAAQEHPAVDEIVVVDDGSSDAQGLVDLLADEPKVHLYLNGENRGVFTNKLEAVARATGEWVVTSDSDNFMDAGFIDKIVSLPKDPQTWFCPSFARENFDYRAMVGKYDLAAIGEIIDRPMFQCLFNTGNQTVHREAFLEVFGPYRGRRADLMMPNYLGLSPAEREKRYWRLVFDALDSFIYNMTWLSAGGRIRIVEGLEYDHYVCASRPEGNYARSPKEKDDLGRVLLKELKTRVLAAKNEPA